MTREELSNIEREAILTGTPTDTIVLDDGRMLADALADRPNSTVKPQELKESIPDAVAIPSNAAPRKRAGRTPAGDSPR